MDCATVNQQDVHFFFQQLGNAELQSNPGQYCQGLSIVAQLQSCFHKTRANGVNAYPLDFD